MQAQPHKTKQHEERKPSLRRHPKHLAGEYDVCGRPSMAGKAWTGKAERLSLCQLRGLRTETVEALPYEQPRGELVWVNQHSIKRQPQASHTDKIRMSLDILGPGAFSSHISAKFMFIDLCRNGEERRERKHQAKFSRNDALSSTHAK